MALGNYLQIDRLTQYDFDGAPESPVSHDSIDADKFMHVYLSGEAAGQSLVYNLHETVAKGVRRLGKKGRASRRKRRNGTFVVTIYHNSMDSKKRYLLRVGVSLAQRPTVVASAELKTK